MEYGLNLAPRLARALNLPPAGVDAAVKLLEAGNTVPFIARYRKEATGELDEEELRQIEEGVAQLRALEDRRRTVLASIESQGKLTPALKDQIENAATRTILEDLYLPYKPRRRTRASTARERGLEPLASLIFAQTAGSQSLSELAMPFLSAKVATTEEAWRGARDIVAEQISQDPEVRGAARDKALDWAVIRARRDPEEEDPRGVYKVYYEFSSQVNRLRPHQILAINRGEAEKILRVQVEIAERDWQDAVQRRFRVNPRSSLGPQLSLAIEDCASRLLLPAIERDVRRILTERAGNQAIRVFGENLRALLLQPPLAGHTILGIDPGFRTGSKLAIIDNTGKVLDTATIYPHAPQKQVDSARMKIRMLIDRHQISLIAIGNGTASRETEEFVADLIRQDTGSALPGRLRNVSAKNALHYLIVNEAGASVYSASQLARQELPGLDVSLRGAVSIARRVQDPLAELVKIDPRSIGIGMYQHDVDQKELTGALIAVVESVVNRVGVDINTASPSLLTHISGIGPQLAEQIVSFRDQHGAFPARSALLEVPGLGPKTFEQAAGFLRIQGGVNPLDGSAIHPESYGAAETILREAQVTLEATPAEREERLARYFSARPHAVIAAALGIGVPTLQDIHEQLLRPGRDPRADLPQPILRQDVLSMEDLNPGMVLQGTIRNVVDFGAFIDIGVKQDGLLHRSQIPRESQMQAGQVLTVKILNVDIERGRIGLAIPGQADDQTPA